MNAIDRWWNDTFPPFSLKRLVFFAAITPIAALGATLTYALATLGTFSSDTYWVTTLGSEFLIGLGWILARRARSGSSPHFTFESRWESRHERTTPSARPRIVSALAAPAGMSRLNDFLLTVAISFVGYSIFTSLTGTGLTGGIKQVAVNFGMGIAIATVIHFRYSPLTFLVVAMLVAVPVAIFYQLFFFFLGGEDSFLPVWAITSAMVFLALLPTWWQMRAARSHIKGTRLPSFVIALGTNVLIILAVAFAGPWSSSQGSEARELPSERTAEAAPAPAPALGATAPSVAASTLFEAWTFNDVERANTVATGAVVSDLFSSRPFLYDKFAGCDAPAEVTICSFETERGRIVLTVVPVADGRYWIQGLERRGS